MTKQELENALRLTGTSQDGEWHLAPDGKSLTFHLASGGVGLTVARVCAVAFVEPQVQFRTTREELFLVNLADIFACMIDQGGSPARKAGFVSSNK